MQLPPDASVSMTFFFGAENPLSNWHPSRFTVNGVDFKNNEQFMMYCKAKLFGDEVCAEKILRTDSPREHKALGRSVRGFDETKWEQKCEHYSLAVWPSSDKTNIWAIFWSKPGTLNWLKLVLMIEYGVWGCLLMIHGYTTEALGLERTGWVRPKCKFAKRSCANALVRLQWSHKTKASPGRAAPA